jgi:hypothetical protein
MLIHKQGDPEAAYAAETAILNDESLSYMARGLLLRILRHAPEWKVNAEHLSVMGREARGRKGESVDKIRSYFREMEEAGYLQRDYVRMAGRGYGTQLNFFDTQQPSKTARHKHDPAEPRRVVYAIGEPNGSRVKIGQTSNLRNRMSDYQTHSPIPLDVLWTYSGGLVLERMLHVEFAHLCVHGEWFDFGDKDPVSTIEGFVRTINTEAFAAVERELKLNRLINGDEEFVWTPPPANAA